MVVNCILYYFLHWILLMKKILSGIFFFYFLILGLSSLWGSHIHHTDSFGTYKSHLAKHSNINHNHESSRQKYCIKYCNIENILTHLLEDKVRGNVFDSSNNQHGLVSLTYIKSYGNIALASLFHVSNTVPLHLKSQRKVISTSSRPPPPILNLK